MILVPELTPFYMDQAGRLVEAVAGAIKYFARGDRFGFRLAKEGAVNILQGMSTSLDLLQENSEEQEDLFDQEGDGGEGVPLAR